MSQKHGVREKYNTACWAAVIIGLLLTGCIVCAAALWSAGNKKEDALRLAEGYAVRTEALLDSHFHKTDVLESIVITGRGEISEEAFRDLAKSLADGEGIRAIQYLPGGAVLYCYPLEGNEAVIGNNVFDNPRRRDDALLAVDTREIALSGPYSLTQGGLGLVARNPIFLTDENGKESFWGFSVIILDLPEALNPLMLEELETEGYDYRLHVITETGEDMTIAGAEQIDEKRSLSYEVSVPNHTWVLSMAPKNGWVNPLVLVYLLLAGWIITALSALLVYQQQRRVSELQRFASIDELTGLYNRRYLGELLDKLCKGENAFAVFYMDLNHFKAVNDELGHAAGDAILKEASERMRSCAGGDNPTARIGGDEFVVVCPRSRLAEIKNMESRLRGVIEKPFYVDGECRQLSLSIGIAVFPEDGNTYDSLMQKADHRMYQEKKKENQKKESQKK